MRTQHNSGRFVAIFAILAATLAASKLAERRIPESLARPLSAIPNDIAGWRSSAENPPLTEGVLAQLKPTSYLSRTYRKGSQELGLFIAYYAQQRAGESMHSPKHCLPGAGWQIWDYGSVNVPVNGSAAKINEYYIQNAGSRGVVLYWYQSRRRIVASEYLGKILLIRDALFDGKTAGSIVRITCPDQPSAIAEALHFASDLIPQLQTFFGR
jgi:EpsI family protein